MPQIEHPDINQIRQHGYPLPNLGGEVVESCDACEDPLYSGSSVIEFNEHLFCDKDCMTEAFLNDPEAFGVENRQLS